MALLVTLPLLWPAAGAAQVRRVAVLDFANTAKDASAEGLGPAAAETIATKLLAVQGLSLVERAHLYQVLNEQKLALSDLVDPAQAVRIGRLVTADQVVLGGYFVFGNVVRFTARFVDTATGTILATSQVDGALDPRNPAALFAALDKLAQATIDSLNTRVAIVAGTPRPVPVETSRRLDPTPDERAKLARAPTNSLEALRAHGNGLTAMRRNNWTESAREHRRAVALDPDYVDAWFGLGEALRALQRFDDALAAYQSQSDAARRRGEQVGQVEALISMAILRSRHQNRDADAEAFAAEALKLAEQFGNEALQERALNQLGLATRRLGRNAEALAYHERSLRLIRKLGLESEEPRALHNVAWIHTVAGRYGEALPLYQRALAIAERADDKRAQSAVLGSLSAVYERQGRHAEALAHLERSVGILDNEGDELQRGLRIWDVVRFQIRRGADAAALAASGRALAVFERLAAAAAPEERLKHGVLAEALEEMGDYHKSRGRYSEASALYQRSVRAFETYRDADGRERVASKLADAAAKTGR